MRVIRACGVLLLLVAPAWPEVFPEARIQEIRAVLDAIYDLDYREAERRCQHMIDARPGDPAGYAYLARTYWSEALNIARGTSIERFTTPDFFAEDSRDHVDAGATVEERFRDATRRAVELARKRIDRNGDDAAALFLLGVAYQNRASFDFAFRRDWWSAVKNGAKNYRLHRAVLRVEPAFTDARLATGVVTYSTAQLPWRARWVAVLLGYRGSRQTGLQELERVAAEGNIAADDARTVLALLYARDRNYEAALAKLREIHQRHPTNYLAHLESAGIELAKGDHTAAIRSYQDALERRYDGLERAMICNRLGVAYRRAGDPAKAAQWLRRAIEDRSASERTVTVARLELGKTFDREGQREQAVEQYDLVLSAPDVVGSRKEATELRRKPYRGV